MTSPPQDITILCPSCGRSFTDWWRPSINLTMDNFDKAYLEKATVKTCPHCGTKVRLDALIVDEEGVWHMGPKAENVPDQPAEAKKTSRYHTQWAGQFYVAAELTRRQYYVAFPLGNAPRTDLLVVAPSKKMIRVEVKSQSLKNFWLLRRHPIEENHFYVFVYLPKDKPPEFFILTCEETQKNRQADKTDLGGLRWADPLPFKDRWDKLPI